MLRHLESELVNSSLLNTTLINETHGFPEIAKLTYGEVWGITIAVSIFFALLSLILTSFIVCCVKAGVSKGFFEKLTCALISLAVGSLFGDAVIHILPEVLGNEEEGHGSSGEENKKGNEKLSVITSLMICLGFLTFLIIEKAFILAGCHTHNEGQHSHEEHLGHEHEHSKDKNDKKAYNNIICDKDHTHCTSEKNEKNDSVKNIVAKVIEIEVVDKDVKENIEQPHVSENPQDENSNKFKLENLENQENLENHDNPIVHQVQEVSIKENKKEVEANNQKNNYEDKKESFASLKNKKTVGWLIIISGGIHNIMDGIAIGLVISSKKVPTIISSVVAIFLHEIPKELGDAGILFHSNFSTWGVLFWNSIINLTGIVGAIIGLSIGSLDDAGSAYSLAYVAGNFLYISLAEMIPIILNKKGVISNVIMFGFLLLGFFIMFMILLLE
jgi:zinc transporter ZupT